MRNVSIRTRLVLLAGISVLALVLVAVAGRIGTQRVADALDRVSNQGLPAVSGV